MTLSSMRCGLSLYCSGIASLFSVNGKFVFSERCPDAATERDVLFDGGAFQSAGINTGLPVEYKGIVVGGFFPRQDKVFGLIPLKDSCVCRETFFIG